MSSEAQPAVVVETRKGLWEGLKARWAAGGHFTDVLVLIGSKVFSQAVAVLAAPLLASLYPPDDFGAWLAFVSLALILSVVANLRYELAVVLPEKDESAANVLALALLIAAAVAALALVLIALLFRPLARLLADANSALWLWTIPPFILLTGIYQVGYNWGTRKKQFTLLAVTDVALSFTTVVFQIGAALVAGPSVPGLILGGLAGHAVATGILVLVIWRRDGRLIRDSFAWRDVGSSFLKYRKFPLYAASYNFLNNLFSRLVFLLLAAYASVHVLGLFGMAMRLMYLPEHFIAAALGQVFFQKAATELAAGSLEPFVVKVLKALVVLMTPVLLFFCFHASWLLGVVFDKAWIGIDTYVLLLASPALSLVLVNWLVRIYDVLGKQRLALIMEVVYGTVCVTLVSVGLIVCENAILAVAFFCITFTLYNICWVGVTFAVARFSMKGLWHSGTLLLFLLAVGGTAGWVVRAVFPEAVAVLVDGILIAVFYAFVFLLWSRSPRGGVAPADRQWLTRLSHSTNPTEEDLPCQR
jgi:O-antigen/teichoic acid export membrane protein